MNPDTSAARDRVAPVPRHHVPRSTEIARSLAAWLIGISGAIASVRGWGEVVMGPADQIAAQRAILLCTGVWALLALVTRWRGMLLSASQLAMIALTTALTSSNAGRASGLIAATGVVAAHAVIVDWRPIDGWPSRPQRTALLALVPLVAAQIVWVLAAAPAPTIALLIITLATVEGYHRALPGLGEADDTLRRATVSLARRTRSLGGRVAEEWRVPSVLGVRLPRDRSTRTAWVLAALASALLMTPLYARYVTEPADVVGSADYALHLELAETTEVFPPAFSTPHPVFHYSVAALTPILGQDGAAIAVLAISSALIAMALVWLWGLELHGRPVRPAIAAAIAVLFFLSESPAIIAQWLEIGNPIDWVPTVHMHLSPTETVLTPFALVQLVLVAGAIERDERLPLRDLTAIGAVTLVSTLAKPSMTMVLLAAIPAYLVLRRPFRRHAAVALVIAFAIPAGLLMLWQTWFLETGAANVGKSGIAIRPMETIRSVRLDESGPLKLSQGLVIPLCLWADARRFVRDAMVGLAVLSTAVGVAVMFLLNETGERSEDGTFTKPVFMAAVVLFVVCWRFLTDELRDEFAAPSGQRRRALLAATALLVLVNLFAGVLSYLHETGVIQLATRGFI